MRFWCSVETKNNNNKLVYAIVKTSTSKKNSNKLFLLEVSSRRFWCFSLSKNYFYINCLKLHPQISLVCIKYKIYTAYLNLFWVLKVQDILFIIRYLYINIKNSERNEKLLRVNWRWEMNTDKTSFIKNLHKWLNLWIKIQEKW